MRFDDIEKITLAPTASRIFDYETDFKTQQSVKL
jgi:hypothetical protein